MTLTQSEKKEIYSNFSNSLSKFALIWFIIIIIYFCLACTTTETFLLVIGSLNAWFLPLIYIIFFTGFLDGFFIIFLKTYGKNLNKFTKRENFKYKSEIIILGLLCIYFTIGIIPFLLDQIKLYPTVPKDVIANLGIADILTSAFLFINMTIVFLIYALFKKNHSSLFSLFAIGGFLLIYVSSYSFLGYLSTYNWPITPNSIPPINAAKYLEEQTAKAKFNDELAMIFYLIYFILIQLAFYLLTNAIFVITNPNKKFLPKKIYLIFFILIISSVVLYSSGEVTHSSEVYSPYISNDKITGNNFSKLMAIRPHDVIVVYLNETITRGAVYRLKEMTVFGAFMSFSIQAIPLCIILYYLKQIPEWITPERKAWLNRFRYGIYLFLTYIALESVSALRNQFTLSYISPYNAVEIHKFLLALALLIFTFALITIFSGIPSLDKWFFDELKFRMTSEVSEINDKTNFSRIWEIIDDMEKNKPLEKKKINQKTMDSYLTMAMDIIEKESIA